MTPTTTTTSRPEIGVDDLVEAGFTPEQIARLEELRAIYPLPEFLSTAEMRRLAFVKWRREHADIVAG